VQLEQGNAQGSDRAKGAFEAFCGKGDDQKKDGDNCRHQPGCEQQPGAAARWMKTLAHATT
jgi:hypothetical protein